MNYYPTTSPSPPWILEKLSEFGEFGEFCELGELGEFGEFGEGSRIRRRSWKKEQNGGNSP